MDFVETTTMAFRELPPTVRWTSAGGKEKTIASSRVRVRLLPQVSVDIAFESNDAAKLTASFRLEFDESALSSPTGIERPRFLVLPQNLAFLVAVFTEGPSGILPLVTTPEIYEVGQSNEEHRLSNGSFVAIDGNGLGISIRMVPWQVDQSSTCAFEIAMLLKRPLSDGGTSLAPVPALLLIDKQLLIVGQGPAHLRDFKT